MHNPDGCGFFFCCSDTFFFFGPNKYALSGQIYTVELGFVYPVLFVSAATESQSV